MLCPVRIAYLLTESLLSLLKPYLCLQRLHHFRFPSTAHPLPWPWHSQLCIYLSGSHRHLRLWPVLVCLDYHRKIPPTRWLKIQEFIFSQFWRMEVQDQYPSWVGFWWDLSPWLVDGQLLTVPTWPFLCVHALLVSSLFPYEDAIPVGLGPSPYDLI